MNIIQLILITYIICLKMLMNELLISFNPFSVEKMRAFLLLFFLFFGAVHIRDCVVMIYSAKPLSEGSDNIS